MRYAIAALALVVMMLQGCTQHQINNFNAAMLGISQGIDEGLANYRRQRALQAYIQHLRRGN